MAGSFKRMGRQALEMARQLTLPLFPAEAPPRVDLPPPVAGPPVHRLRSGQSARRIRLGGDDVDYALKRSARRTIGFMIDDRGLTVTAPRWVTIAEIEQALHEKARWISRKRIEWRQHAARREQLAIRWEHGAPVPFLGETLLLTLVGGSGRVCRDEQRLVVPCAGAPAADVIRNRVQPWLKEQARACFAQRITLYAARLGRSPSSWMLSSARTRWGTCTADGVIRLNWRLVHFPLHIVDYVVAHELSHLNELNHGPRFWATVRSLYPDCEAARDWLRAYPDDITD